MKLITVITLCTLFICASATVTVAQKTRPIPRRNDPEKVGYTRLMRAAERGQVKVVRALFKERRRG